MLNMPAAPSIDRLTLVSLCGLIFTLPFSKSMVEVFFGLALLFWILKIAGNGKLRISLMQTASAAGAGFKLAVFSFVSIAFLSVLNSCSFGLSVKGFFFKLLEWVAIYFLIAANIDDKKKLNTVLAVMVLSMVLMAVDGILQAITGMDFIRGVSIGASRVLQGPFGSRNSLGGWLVVMIPLAFSLVCAKEYFLRNLPEKPGWIKRSAIFFLWSMIAILAILLVLTYSRGAWMGLLIAMILFGILKNKRLLIIILISLSVSYFFLPYSVKRRLNPTVISSETARTAFWREALGIVEDFPILGCGLNTYAAVGPYYKVPGGGGCYPHNSYLQMAAETGLLGLGAFLWVIAALFKTSLGNLQRIKDTPYGAVLIGLLAGLAGFLVQSFVDVNVYSLQLGNLMWIIMGLAVATQRIALADKKRGI